MLRTLCKLLVCLAPFWLNVFDLVSSLFSIKYTGIEDSNVLVLFAVAVLLFVAAVYLWSLLKCAQISTQELLCFAIIVLYLLLHIIIGEHFWGNGLYLLQHMRKAAIYSLICVLSFYTIRRENWLAFFFQAIKWFAIAASVIIAYRMLPQLQRDWTSVVYYGTLRYQSMGYLCASIVVLLLVYLREASKALPRVIYCVLIGATIISLVLSGARGAVLALIVVAAAILILSVKNGTSALKLLLGGIIVVALIFAGNGLLHSVFHISSAFADRTFDYLSGGQVSLDNRNDVYAQAIALIMRSPIFGYGVGSSYYYLGNYPHNIFLEFMMEGGIPYTAFMAIVMIFRLSKWVRIFRNQRELRGVFAIILLNLANLLVSGTYYINAWFFLFITFDVSISATQVKLNRSPAAQQLRQLPQ